MQSGGMDKVLMLRGMLNSFPERLYQVGHLLMFLAPTHEHARAIKAELFSNSPFVTLVEAPEPDEESVFHRIMAEQLSGPRDADVIACARQSAAWIQRRASGRDRLLRKEMDELKDIPLNRAFLDENDVQDLDELFLADGFLDRVERELYSRIYKQEEAIREVLEGLSDVVAQLRNARDFGLQRPSVPLFKRLLVGPSGTGKSHLPRVVSEILFDRAPYELRMQNITNRTSVVGAPAGHVGFGQVHSGLESLHKTGSGVVLIDEWERAGSDGSSRKAIHDTFMSVFEEGQLDTEDRRRVSFHNCLIFVTSNLAMYEADFGWVGLSSGEIKQRVASGIKLVEQSAEERREAYEKYIMIPNKDDVCIEPPWLGRLGGQPIVFDHFSKEDMIPLAQIEWMSHLKRLAESNDRDPPETVAIDEPSLGPLYCGQFDVITGARKLKSVIGRQFNDLLMTTGPRGLWEREIAIGMRDGKAALLS